MTTALCAIFFLSGASALAFETLWFRQAGLAFGNSVWASSLVLAGFMGGIGLGNAAAIRFGDRLRQPIRAYALLEVAIAVAGIALVFALPSLGPWVGRALGPLEAEPWVLNPLRLGLSFALLLVPSTAMGLTLPLLARALSARDANFGRVLGRLYGWNTLGAVCGVCVAEWLWIGALGIRGTALAAGCLNGLAAGASLWLARRTGAAPAAPPPAAAASLGAGLPWLVAAFGSGFALLALEVVWFRFLGMFVRGLSEVFALMLGLVLAGIALGGLAAAAWLARAPAAHRFAPAVSLLAGAVLLVSYIAAPELLPYERRGQIVGVGELLRFAAPAMLPVCFLSGVFFTLAGAGLRERAASEVRAAGALTFANTVGAALGPLAAGFVLLPTWGMERSLFGLALLYAAIALWLIVSTSAARGVALVTAAGFAGAAFFYPFGSMRERHLLTGLEQYLGDADVRAVHEGVNETLVYLERTFMGHSLDFRMLTNGYSMAGTMMQARRYMNLYVYLPAALHPNLESALLISFGTGSTARALTHTRSLERIDVVDISPDVLEMSRIIYSDPAEHPLNDPRVTVHVEDGRYFLQTTDRKFDLITAEPPPPELSGIVNLYSREYFELVRDRLAEGGFATYWLPLFSVSDGTARSILRAFCDAFVDCSLWHGNGANVMMVGTRGARGGVSVEQFSRQWRDPRVAGEMAALGFERPEQLGALFIGDAWFLELVTDGAPPLVDDFPKRMAPRVPVSTSSTPLFDEWSEGEPARERFRASPWVAQFFPEALRRSSLAYFEAQEIINYMGAHGRSSESPEMERLHHLLTRTSLEAPPLWLMGGFADLTRAVAATPPPPSAHPGVHFYYGIQQLAQRNYAAAVEPLRRAVAVPHLQQDAFHFGLYAMCMAGDAEAAQRFAAQAFERSGPPDPTPYWRFMKEHCGVDPIAGNGSGS